MCRRYEVCVLCIVHPALYICCWERAVCRSEYTIEWNECCVITGAFELYCTGCIGSLCLLLWVGCVWMNGLCIDLSMQLSARSDLMPMGFVAWDCGWVNHSEWCEVPMRSCIGHGADGTLLLSLSIVFVQVLACS